MSPKTFKHFQILELLGRGGMGEVYLAQDNTLERKVALKFLPRDLLRDPSAQGRLLDEARSVSRVQHPNIATVHSIEEDGGIFALCMEYVEGFTLKQLMARGPIPMKKLVKYGADMAAALQAAHEQGVIHRDIKPANVMVTPRGEVKVMDFGLALRPERVVHTLGPNTYGTVQYMSPEQARGEKLTPRSDIFSFGSTLYELTSGRPPFTAKNDLAILHAIISDEPMGLRSHRRDVPPALEQLVRRCMFKQINNRWASMKEILDELRYILPTVETGPRDLISELSDGLSEQKPRPHHQPANAGRVGQREQSQRHRTATADLTRSGGSPRPASDVKAVAVDENRGPASPKGGCRTAEFSVVRPGTKGSSDGLIGNSIEIKDVPVMPRRPGKRLKAVRESDRVSASRAAAVSRPRPHRSGPRTNVFENLGEQLGRESVRPRLKRPKRESVWSIVLPLALAVLVAAAAGYGLLRRAGVDPLRTSPVASQAAPANSLPNVQSTPTGPDDRMDAGLESGLMSAPLPEAAQPSATATDSTAN